MFHLYNTPTFIYLLQQFYHGTEKEVIREDTREREVVQLDKGTKPGEKLMCKDDAHCFYFAQKEHALFKRHMPQPGQDDKDGIYDLYHTVDVGFINWLTGGVIEVPTLEFERGFEEKQKDEKDERRIQYHHIRVAFGGLSVTHKRITGWGMPKCASAKRVNFNTSGPGSEQAGGSSGSSSAADTLRSERPRNRRGETGTAGSESGDAKLALKNFGDLFIKASPISEEMAEQIIGVATTIMYVLGIFLLYQNPSLFFILYMMKPFFERALKM